MMNRIRRSPLSRRLLQAGLAVAVVLGAATQLSAPAAADNHNNDWRYQHNHNWDRHDRRDWRHNGRWDHGRYYRPYYGPRVYNYPYPQPYYYAPAPSFSFGFTVPVH